MMKALFPALILSGTSVAVLYPAPANAQLDFWNKPKVEFSIQREALDTCKANMPAAIAFWAKESREMGNTPDRVKDAYCVAYQNRKWKDLGGVRGEYTYYYTDEWDNVEIKKSVVIPGLGSYKWNKGNRRVTIQAPRLDQYANPKNPYNI